MSLRSALAAAVLAAVPGTAQAQVSRVFVSVNGNDANVCSNIATPCRTLGGGVAQVDAHGEVIVVDSGSFAGTTITKSVKINVAAGAVAFSALPIFSNPGPGGIVVLRGLTLKAATVGTGIAITHQSGTLFVENAVVDGWQYGLLSNSVGTEDLFVKGSVFRNQAQDGIAAQAPLPAHTAIEVSYFEKNGGYGVRAYAAAVRVSNSVMTKNNVGAASTADADLTIQGCEVSGNVNIGLHAQEGGVLRVSHSTIVRNNFGLSNATSTVYSYGNNVVTANTLNAVGTITPAALQ